MAESGCLRDGKFDALECNSFRNHGGWVDRFSDFLAGTTESIVDATGATITQANGVTGASAGAHAPAAAHMLVANAISDIQITAAAVTTIHLPEAIANTLCVADFSGDLDEANAMTINTYKATDVYARHNITVDHSDNGGSDHAASHHGVQTAGTSKVPTSVNLIYTPAAAATNHFSINSQIFFYCKYPGRWLVKIMAVAEGVGSTGAWTVS